MLIDTLVYLSLVVSLHFYSCHSVPMCTLIRGLLHFYSRQYHSGYAHSLIPCGLLHFYSHQCHSVLMNSLIMYRVWRKLWAKFRTEKMIDRRQSIRFFRSIDRLVFAIDMFFVLGILSIDPFYRSICSCDDHDRSVFEFFILLRRFD